MSQTAISEDDGITVLVLKVKRVCTIFYSRTSRFIAPLGRIAGPFGNAEPSTPGEGVDTRIPSAPRCPSF